MGTGAVHPASPSSAGVSPTGPGCAVLGCVGLEERRCSVLGCTYDDTKRRRGSGWRSDELVPDHLPLPCDDTTVWKAIVRAWVRYEDRVRGRDPQKLLSDSRAVAMSEMIGCYSRAVNPRHGFDGIAAMFRFYPETQPTFLLQTLPFIIEQARALPDRLALSEPSLMSTSLSASDESSIRTDNREKRRLCMLKYGKATVQVTAVERPLVLSLLANSFLGTLSPDYSQGLPMPYLPYDRSLPDPRILQLLDSNAPQEVAKLRMIVNYFERCQQEMPEGSITIHRHRSELGDVDYWCLSERPLARMFVMQPGVAFEDIDDKHMAHADFANKCIGGGVLGGGCVQEEIRFSVCPENIVAMLLCPNMRDDEALQICGAEQFSKYQGYAFRLRYAGNHVAPQEYPKEADGTPLAVLACMDALDFRSSNGADLEAQMQPALMLREANKAYAAFYPCIKRTKDLLLATGNWGSGAFLGCAELKALLQWAAASQAGRTLVYFPFDRDKTKFAANLAALVQACEVEGDVRRPTVGDLWRALEVSRMRKVDADRLFDDVRRWLLEAQSLRAGDGVGDGGPPH